jgi:hypothetical protein
MEAVFVFVFVFVFGDVLAVTSPDSNGYCLTTSCVETGTSAYSFHSTSALLCLCLKSSQPPSFQTKLHMSSNKGARMLADNGCACVSFLSSVSNSY